MEEPAHKAAEMRRCEWCSASAGADATICPGCGAAMPTADAEAEIYYPGVTDIHPHLKAAAARPLQVPQGASTTQMMSGSVLRFASQAGPGGTLLGLGAVAAMAAVEWMGASKRNSTPGPSAGVAFIDSLIDSPKPPDRDLKHVLEQLDGKWKVGRPPGPVTPNDASRPAIPDDEIPDPPERPLPL
jgi:hypothetical protein